MKIKLTVTKFQTKKWQQNGKWKVFSITAINSLLSLTYKISAIWLVEKSATLAVLYSGPQYRIL